MFSAIYIEKNVIDHPKTKEILTRFNGVEQVVCNHFGEIFNRKKQSFKLQKENPALIIAQKTGKTVLKTPAGYGIGEKNNYYFSHMLNCIFDCRYCFLQGMFRSAHYVFFVNSDQFSIEMDHILQSHTNEAVYFFSGYDCDSLALESVTGFVSGLLPYFEKRENAYLELRTKSTNINFLLKRKPLKNCIVAYTISPDVVVKQLEHKTPSLERRLDALKKLKLAGWQIGLRFDPVIYMDDFETVYREFFEKVFKKNRLTNIHSVTLGTFRVPKTLFKNMKRLYPHEKLFSHSLQEKNQLITYKEDKENKLLTLCYEKIKQHIPENIVFTS